MGGERSRFFGTHFRGFAAGPFNFSLSRATVCKEDLPEHQHDDAHFILAIDAGYLSRAFGSADELGRGLDLIYNPPGTEHRDCFFEPGGRFLSIGVPAAMAPTAADPVQLKAQRPHAVMTGMLGLCAAGYDNVELILEERLLELLACVGEDESIGVAPRWLARADALIDGRATDQSVTVTALANELRIHPVYFARAYRAARGYGPAAAIQKRRIQVAAAMMSLDLTLAEIAFECGFADQSHLCRTVGKTFGTPPSRLKAAFA